MSTLLAYAYTFSAQGGGMGLKTGNFGYRVLTFKQSSHTAIFIEFRAFAKLRDEANSMRFDCRVSRPTLHFHCRRNMRSRSHSRGLSVRPSVCPIIRPQQRHAASLLLSAGPPAATDTSPQHGAAARSSAANPGNATLSDESTIKAELTTKIREIWRFKVCRVGQNGATDS